MLVQFSIVPVGTGESVGKEVSEVLGIIDASGITYKVNAMGTIVEGEWDELFTLIRRCHEHMRRHSARVITTITVDDRSGVGNAIFSNVQSLETRLGRSLKK